MLVRPISLPQGVVSWRLLVVPILPLPLLLLLLLVCQHIVIVEGTFELFATLQSPPEANSSQTAEFGQAAAIQGSKLVVTESRFAHVYQRMGARDWEFLTTLEPAAVVDEATSDASFGRSVAYDGTTIAVGAPDGGANNEGVVYLYEERTTVRKRLFRPEQVEWRLIQTVTATDPQPDDEFGFRVALHGGRLAVSIRSDDEMANRAGSAQVFQRIASPGRRGERDDAEWIPDGGLIIAADADVDDRFGNSIAIYQDLLVVGAMLDDDTAQASGSVYVFRRSSSQGVWELIQKLVAGDPGSVDRFGSSVTISDKGSMIVVGAFADNGQENDQGSVYVFETQKGGSSFVQTSKLSALIPEIGAQLGRVVSVQGGLLVAGAWKDIIGSQDDAGSVLVFNSTIAGFMQESTRRRWWWHHGADTGEDFSGNRTFEELQKLTVIGTPAIGDTFGSAVALGCEGTLVIGAPGRSEDKGEAYLYYSADFFPEAEPRRRFSLFNRWRVENLC